METNKQLVNYLERRGYIESSKVEEAFRKIDRKDFVPESYNHEAYRDHAIPLEVGDATVSGPHMVAIHTELLEVDENCRVLEIGSGSGYQLAILSELADRVTGVEVREELVEFSRENLSSIENVEVVQGNGVKAARGKFDRIIYSCAVKTLDRAKKKLEEDGVIVGPVKEGSRQIVKKWEHGETTEYNQVRFSEFIDED